MDKLQFLVLINSNCRVNEAGDIPESMGTMADVDELQSSLQVEFQMAAAAVDAPALVGVTVE